MIRWGAGLLVASWVPIVLVGTLSPDANPIGLGLLAWAGSAVALGLIALGVLAALLRFLRAR
jgi:hypothetical protein